MGKVTCKINIVHYSCNLSSLSVNLVCCIISLKSPQSIIRVCMPLWHSLVRYYVSFRSIIQWINLILFVCFSYAVKFSSAHIKDSLSVSDYSFVSYDTVFFFGHVSNRGRADLLFLRIIYCTCEYYNSYLTERMSFLYLTLQRKSSKLYG